MTLSAYVKPRLLSLAGDLARVVPRVVAGGDGEAVHDLRVALRKLRSVLRVVRRLYGRFHTDAVRDAFKRVADATGALRDEEVLAETLSELELSPDAREALSAWVRARQARRERKLRKEVVALVGGGALDQPSALLGALLTLPVDPDRDKPAARFARKVVFSALDDIENAQPVDPSDVVHMHELRILYKRLRYAVDAFEGVLPPEFGALERAAAAFQKRLGTIHDLDVALDVIEGAEGLLPEARSEMLAALGRERVRQVDKYERERARGAHDKAPEAEAGRPDGKGAAAAPRPVGRNNAHANGKARLDGKAGVDGKARPDGKVGVDGKARLDGKASAGVKARLEGKASADGKARPAGKGASGGRRAVLDGASTPVATTRAFGGPRRTRPVAKAPAA